MSDEKNASSGTSDQNTKGSAENTDTGMKSVSELLAEWEQERSGSDGKTEKPGKDQLAALKAELDELKSDRKAELEGRDYKNLLSTIAGDNEVPNSVIDGWLRERAENDPAIIKAFDNRSEKPAQFKELVNALKPEFEKWAKDNLAPKDSGLKAAVRNARESSSDSDGFDGIKWASLSDNEFEAKAQEVVSFAEKGGFK